MSCPTCGLPGTVHLSGDWRWCPSCGTVAETGGDTHTPKLVERCRRFEAALMTDAGNLRRPVDWCVLGIAESINLPADRPDPPKAA